MYKTSKTIISWIRNKNIGMHVYGDALRNEISCMRYIDFALRRFSVVLALYALYLSGDLRT